MKKQKLGPALTWEEIADVYTENFSGKPRIRPMDEVFDRVESLPNIHMDEKEGTLYKILE